MKSEREIKEKLAQLEIEFKGLLEQEFYTSAGVVGYQLQIVRWVLE